MQVDKARGGISQEAVKQREPVDKRERACGSAGPGGGTGVHGVAVEDTTLI